MNPGDLVRVLAPFDGAFPDVYTVRELVGSTAFLDGIPTGFADAFDVSHLEAV